MYPTASPISRDSPVAILNRLSTLKRLSGKKKKPHLQNLLTDFTSPRSLAEAIADTMKINDSPDDTFPMLESDNWTISISESEIQKCLMKLSLKKAPGPEGIPNQVYRLLAPYIAGPLKAIFDRSVADRDFPQDWKRAIIVPIPKTSPPILQKLRTISLLPTPSKIFEKLILKKMLNQIEPLFGDCQHGFRATASTSTALLQIVDTSTLFYDDPKNKGFAILSLDLSKAFDKVNHRVLIEKITDSLPRGFVSWLNSYLSG